MPARGPVHREQGGSVDGGSAAGVGHFPLGLDAGATRPQVPPGAAGVQVVVDGWGPLAEEASAQLRRCRVAVQGGRHAADGAEVALGLDGRRPAAVVLVAEGRRPGWVGAPWQARGVPHLPIVLQVDRLVVGPLVLPGRTACLECAAPDRSEVSGPGAVPPESVVLAAAVATVTVLAVLRGDPGLGGISTEIGLSGLSVTHRLWNPVPGCRCARGRMAG